MSGAFQLLVLNTLSNNGSGTVNINVTGTGTGTNAAVSLGGSLSANSGTLIFQPATISTLAFNGPIAPATTAVKQNLDGTGTLLLTSSTFLEINNAEGLTLGKAITVNGGLRFTLGLITTDLSSILNLPLTVPTVNITGARSSNASGVGGSFVNGPVSRSTPSGTVTALLFPVGKVGAPSTAAPNGVQNYRPVFLTTISQTNAVNYTAEQFEASARTGSTVLAPLDHVSSQRYFVLSPSPAPANFNGTVTLSYGTDDLVTNSTINSFVVAKRNNGATVWTSIGTANVSSTGNYDGTYKVGTLMSAPFSTTTNTFPSGGATAFSLASTTSSTSFPGLNPLPVELSRFDATAKAQGVNVTWATASEKNSDRFDVQRSADGTAFETIGTVKGQGNSTTTHEYAFIDSRPVVGLAYYRLHQVDVDGTSAFSPVATATWGKMLEMAAFPNPSAGVITLPASVGKVHYRIYNVLGQTLLSGQAAGNDRLDVSSLPKGSFFLELTGDAGRATQRLLRE